ncbi:hypothetical protein GCM10027416_32820 [Okibacterium endophyticum]
MHLLAVLSMKNRALIALVTIVVAVFGGLALTSLKQELAPNVEFPQLAIVTDYPGAAPEVVNDDVSLPIETAIQGVDGIESTSATSSTNLSLVSATFTYGTDLATAEQKIMQAINRIGSQLPEDLDPQVLSGGLSDLPVIQLAVSGDNGTDELTDLIEQSAIPDIEDVDGVRAGSLIGAVGQRLVITPDDAALAAAGLQRSDISQALEQNGVLLPAGEITEGDQTLAVQTGTKLGSADDIAELPIVGTTPGASVTTIGDIASVELADNPITSISRVNGEPALTIAVTKLPDANTVDVSQGVRAILPQIEESLGESVTVTVVFDQAPYIEQSIEALGIEGVLGLVFAILIILIFLLDVRATIVTAISIPTSVLITFIGLQASNYSLNILTLGALTISIGRVVDDSIVVIENIKRHMSASRDRTADGRAAIIVRAVREVAGAITASTITTVAVFLPLAFVSDMTGELFRPFALTVTIALLASLLVALTIVPVLAYWFLRAREQRAPKPAKQAKPTRAERKELAKAQAADALAARSAETTPAPESDPGKVADGRPLVAAAPVIVDEVYIAPTKEMVDAGRARQAAAEQAMAEQAEAERALSERAVPTRRSRRGDDGIDDDLETPTRLQRGYLPIINWTLRHSVTTLLLSVLVLGGTLALVPFMKTNFLGDTGQNTLSVSQTLPVGSSLEAQDAAASEVEEVLRGIDGIETVQLSIGSSGSALADAFGGGGAGTVTYSITTDPDAEQVELQDRVRNELEDLTDAGTITVGTAGGFGASNDIEVDVTAPTEAALNDATQVLTEAAGEVDGVLQVTNTLTESRPYIAVVVDRAAAAAAGYSEVALGSVVSAAMQPQTIGSVAIDDSSVSIYLATEDPPTTVQELVDLQVPTLTGPVALDELASVEEVDGPDSITAVRGQRSATVVITPSSDNIGTVSAEIQSMIDGTSLDSGASASLGGVSEDQNTAFQQLGIAMLAAILIVYIVMVATFRSLRQPLLLLVSVPFAATGAIGLQVLTGVPLGVASLVGVLMLIGIVVTNAIVLVDLINQYRRRGMSAVEAVRHGASRRLRPILMTALATIFALVPMALGITGHGGFISQPLAIVVIGGLVSSTVLTLVVLPTLYNLVEGARERRVAKREAKAAAASAEG